MTTYILSYVTYAAVKNKTKNFELHVYLIIHKKNHNCNSGYKVPTDIVGNEVYMLEENSSTNN